MTDYRLKISTEEKPPIWKQMKEKRKQVLQAVRKNRKKSIKNMHSPKDTSEF